MNKEGNTYTLLYASILVTLVAVGLAFTAEVLHPQQSKNEAIDKMQQILAAVNVPANQSTAEALYQQTIVSTRFVDNEEQHPVFEALVGGQKKYILALRGTGLWGPIWGYLALNDDKNTVFGASFGHAGETPGLGAEIALPPFAARFAGKKIFNAEAKFTSIAIVKPGKSVPNKDYVDGISGGTITSRGVDAMLYASLEVYVPFLNSEADEK
ncbi:Na(+)-translocating NADH-quinone reductase subunit C [Bacteroidia bacterium]|nr:Na(+)-translocating NADH-quinone reductase subunit C [Bacteroidia bacterium]